MFGTFGFVTGTEEASFEPLMELWVDEATGNLLDAPDGEIANVIRIFVGVPE